MLSSVYAPKDFKRLRVVGDLVARCFDYISPYIVAGISTGEIDRLVAEFLKENGARSSDLGYMGYPKSICTSINEVVCHGIPSDDVVLNYIPDVCDSITFSKEPTLIDVKPITKETIAEA